MRVCGIEQIVFNAHPVAKRDEKWAMRYCRALRASLSWSSDCFRVKTASGRNPETVVQKRRAATGWLSRVAATVAERTYKSVWPTRIDDEVATFTCCSCYTRYNTDGRPRRGARAVRHP